MARLELDRGRLEAFMKAIAARTKGPGTLFLTGGASAVLIGWRGMTVDIDLKADPEPVGLFDSICPKLIRYPAIDPTRFAQSVTAFLHG